MQFTHTEEQAMLADSIRGFLQRAESQKLDPSRIWSGLAEAGALGASLPESLGGYGGGGRELSIIAGEVGRVRARVPFMASVAIAATMIAQGADQSHKPVLLEKLIAGEEVATLAWQERHSRYSVADIETEARETGEGWQLRGAKSQVLYGATADWFLVTAKSAGEVAVFLVASNAKGLSREPVNLIDGQPAADIRLDDVLVGPEARLDGGAGLVELGIDWGRVALAADTLACLDLLLEKTVEYIKLRVQFGKPIGKNQALQHRATEMLHHVEKSRGMVILAAESLNGASAEERMRAVAQMGYIVHKAARFVGEQAVQLHGGMGMSDELDISHYVKRVYLNEMILGDADNQLEVLHGIELMQRRA